MPTEEQMQKAGWPEGFTPTPQSSNVEALRIQPSNEDPDVVQLQVIFKNRSRYHYSRIPRAQAEGILAEGVSAGRYLNAIIKPLCEEDGSLLGAYWEQVDLVSGDVLTQEADTDEAESKA